MIWSIVIYKKAMVRGGGCVCVWERYKIVALPLMQTLAESDQTGMISVLNEKNYFVWIGTIYIGILAYSKITHVHASTWSCMSIGQTT